MAEGILEGEEEVPSRGPVAKPLNGPIEARQDDNGPVGALSQGPPR